MKKVLCFGDSNVYGFVPLKGSRYSADERWSGILKQRLNGVCDVVEAGMNGRTCFSDCPEDEMIGIKAIKRYLEQKPDIIILAIGINDLQTGYFMTEEKFEQGLKRFICFVRETCPLLRVILLSPSSLNESLFNTFFSCLFDESSIELSKKISLIYERLAKEFVCDFIDLDKIVQTSLKDGLHYEPDMHRKIAEVLLDYLE